MANELNMNRQLAIEITVIVDGESHTIKTFRGAYRSVMALLYDQLYIDGFGECKGVGRCGTCHVRILNPSDELLAKAGNELATLSKMELVYHNSRLACQMNVDESLDGLHIQITSDDFT